ncbi:glycosyltransferase family 4 protein [Legionella clemsonensis]|uniref:Teichuronic acid biosynthesis glycosyltransferase TuaC n=1 Tax=Legionella clemsonensis TaxID=1867846 RepID=A0A222P3G3_9GAMM|nr:glycosyltransferase family 4 protein [Legionella clemsonensis]ASQ46400.1 Putative teichuronic acid biosynthesis glycosyltransferase TuaC [Legionella clemsonensis]
MAKKIESARIARVSTVPLFVYTLLRTQVEAIANTGAEVTIITSPGDLHHSIQPICNCQYEHVKIAREISIISDLKTLIKLVMLFHVKKFDIVHSNTPKAGLLCAIAAKLTGTPIRLHTFTGQTWATASGIKRAILKFCDKVISRLNTHCYADSPSQQDYLIKNKVIHEKKISVLGKGSLAGVNLSRFSQSNFSEVDKKAVCDSLNIKKDQLVVLFVGRVTRDKGIFELIESFGQLLENNVDAVLLIVGPFEQDIEQKARMHAQKHCKKNVIFVGFCPQPEKFMAIADILCLPSYREGFGTVVIEAAAMEVPAIGTKIYGLTDAIVDGETGLLVEPKNVEQLTVALKTLASNPELRQKMAKNAKARAIREFDSGAFGDLVINDYKNLLNNEDLAS